MDHVPEKTPPGRLCRPAGKQQADIDGWKRISTAKDYKAGKDSMNKHNGRRPSHVERGLMIQLARGGRRRAWWWSAVTLALQ
jgi:hypothetical protein